MGSDLTSFTQAVQSAETEDIGTAMRFGTLVIKTSLDPYFILSDQSSKAIAGGVFNQNSRQADGDGAESGEGLSEEKIADCLLCRSNDSERGLREDFHKNRSDFQDQWDRAIVLLKRHERSLHTGHEPSCEWSRVSDLLYDIVVWSEALLPHVRVIQSLSEKGWDLEHQGKSLEKLRLLCSTVSKHRVKLKREPRWEKFFVRDRCGEREAYDSWCTCPAGLVNEGLRGDQRKAAEEVVQDLDRGTAHFKSACEITIQLSKAHKTQEAVVNET